MKSIKYPKLSLLLSFVGIIITLTGAVCMPARRHQDPRLEQIKLPPGFQIEVFADHVENARSLCQGDKGTIFVGTRNAGNVYAIPDRDQNFHADTVITIAKGLNMPNGVAFQLLIP